MKRFSNVSSAVTETAPESESDQIRTESEQSQSRSDRQTDSLSASQEFVFDLTEARWQQALQAGFTNRIWVEQETRMFVLKAKIVPKHPDKAWLAWLYRGKEYADRNPKVVPIQTPPRRSKMFFAEG